MSFSIPLPPIPNSSFPLPLPGCARSYSHFIPIPIGHSQPYRWEKHLPRSTRQLCQMKWSNWRIMVHSNDCSETNMYSIISNTHRCNRLGHEDNDNRVRRGARLDKWQLPMWFRLSYCITLVVTFAILWRLTDCCIIIVITIIIIVIIRIGYLTQQDANDDRGCGKWRQKDWVVNECQRWRTEKSWSQNTAVMLWTLNRSYKWRQQWQRLPGIIYESDTLNPCNGTVTLCWTNPQYGLQPCTAPDIRRSMR